eukprot:TRINITY_DN12234_c0_g1_i1.p1 TRINITY_DN12234_c0_g1~~TRINITY_DN12234_c0_g1_i1.p1  ORF type:complete len:647 (+),score=82.71 TRINITY_DN12234_c0_g1_i1:144-2084(+)
MTPPGTPADANEPGGTPASADDIRRQSMRSMSSMRSSFRTGMATISSIAGSVTGSSSSRSRRFIRKTNSMEEREVVATLASPFRIAARQFSRHAYFETFSGFVVFLDFVSICRDTDCKAAAGECTDPFASTTMVCCFAFYVADLILRLCADGCGALKNRMQMLDAFVICASLFEWSVDFVHNTRDGSSVLLIRMVRLCRLLRLVRVIKLFAGMKELRRLTQMIATCARTMLWSFLMAFLVMTMWAVAAVELVHPVAQKLEGQGIWEEKCERCGRAFETVMATNLTFFQTVLAGDAWGVIALPIIEDTPSTAIVFCGSVLTLTFGIMQLITAVVVDTFADLRKMDVNALADELEAEERQEKTFLFEMFGAIDSDRSGHVSYMELADGAFRVKDFQDWLRVMDIDEADLGRLFKYLDVHNTGQIELVEFVDVLYRMRNAEQKTTSKLVKHMIDNLEQTAESLVRKVDAVNAHLQRLDSSWQRTSKTPEISREVSILGDVDETEPSLEARVPEHGQHTMALETALTLAVAKLQSVCEDSLMEPHTVLLGTVREKMPPPTPPHTSFLPAGHIEPADSDSGFNVAQQAELSRRLQASNAPDGADDITDCSCDRSSNSLRQHGHIPALLRARRAQRTHTCPVILERRSDGAG